MYGVSDLLKSIEKAGGRVDEAVKQCVDNCLELVGMKMQLFMMDHRISGDTYRSFEQAQTIIKKNTVEGMIGYDVKKGGLPAIFLDVGTPKMKPYFFRYYAINNTTAEQQRIHFMTRGFRPIS
jgi:hypothetical protein